MDVSPSDGGTVEVNQNAWSSYPSSYTFETDAVVSLKAVPASGYEFDSWIGEVVDPSSVTTTVTMDCDKTVTANFSRETAPTPEPVAKPPLNWPLVGGILGGVVVVGFLIFALAIRHRA